MESRYLRRVAAAFTAGVLTLWLAGTGHAQTGSSTYSQKDKPLVQPGATSAEANTPDPAKAPLPGGHAAALKGGGSAGQNTGKATETQPTSGSAGH